MRRPVETVREHRHLCHLTLGRVHPTPNSQVPAEHGARRATEGDDVNAFRVVIGRGNYRGRVEVAELSRP